jgi:hypothetical protein
MASGIEFLQRSPQISLSLGLLSFNNSKIKKQAKISYLRLIDLIRCAILSLKQLNFSINIKGVPKFLKDILRELFKKSNKLIVSPFNDVPLNYSVASEDKIVCAEVNFVKSYGYSSVKIKKLGKVKRKIKKRILAVNNVID